MQTKSRRTLPLRFTAAAVVLSLTTAACAANPGKKSAVKSGGDDKATTGGDDVKGGTVTVTALSTIGSGEQIKGGGHEIKVTLTSEKGERLKVGFVDDEVGGTGSQWRASGWMGTAVAILISGKNPGGKEVRFENSGFTEGPSAGALVTVGVLAALRGDKIKDNVTMTGTINPDGTIGPVGGIPQKLDGAKEKGKTLVLIPTGQRTSPDEKTGENVDVVELGRQKDLEVKEVGDIYETYEIFTGKKLPQPSTDGFKAELDKKSFDRIAAKTTEWLARYQSFRGQYGGLQFRDEDYDAEIAQADELAEKAQSLKDQGLQARAYGQAVQATVSAAITIQSLKLIEAAVNGGAQGVRAQLDSASAAEAKVTALVDTLKGEKPENVSDFAGVMSAYGAAVDAISLLRFADALAAGEDPTANVGASTGRDDSPLGKAVAAAQEEESGIPGLSEAELTAAFTSVLYYNLADLSTELSKDLLAFGTDLEGPKLGDDVMVDSVAEFFRGAADANLNLFETLIVEGFAEDLDLSNNRVRALLRQADFDYALASAAAENIAILDEYFKDEEALAYAKLGASTSLYSRAGALIAKYYALDADLDEDLNVVGIPREKALIAMLDLATKQVERGAAVLERNKVSPAPVIAAYESARGNREEGDPELKLDALSEFWGAYVQARALAFLGGFAEKV